MNGPIIGRALLALTNRMRGFDTLDVLQKMQGAPFRSRDEIRENQFGDLSALL